MDFTLRIFYWSYLIVSVAKFRLSWVHMWVWVNVVGKKNFSEKKWKLKKSPPTYQESYSSSPRSAK